MLILVQQVSDFTEEGSFDLHRQRKSHLYKKAHSKLQTR